MHLPFFKSKPPISRREYLYALEINHNLTKTAIWAVVNNQPQVVSAGPTVEWDDQSEDSLLTACDQSISACTDKFDPTGKVVIKKVVLGLPSDWLASEKIAQDKLHLLKNIFQKLELNAVGFVVLPEAISKYLQQTEKMPPTSILIGVSPNNFEISLVKMGKIFGSQIVRRSHHPAADVTEGLSRFSDLDMLPSRMLLYDTSTSLEPLQQQLLAHSWQAPQHRLPFLHLPKIEILPPDFSLTAIALAGGQEVAQAIGLISESVEPEPVVSDSESTSFTPPPTYPISPLPSSIREVSSPEELGFVISDNDDSTPSVSTSLTPVERTARPDQEYVPLDVSTPASLKRPHLLSTFKLPRFSRSKFSLAVIAGLALLLVIGLGAAYWYLPHATITLSLDTKSLSNQFELLADTTRTSPDPSVPAIPATQIETNLEKSQSTPATGNKLIGDKATGVVSLINGTSSPKSFPAGTVITSPSGLKFLFAEAVTVDFASGSADPNSYQPGKASVKVVADQIGTDSNLTAGTQFKVGNFSALDFVAKNDSAFSGGSSKQVKAVSKDDYATLRKALTDAAKDQARQELLAKISSDQVMIEPSIQLTTVSEQFDHKLDEVADSVSLKLTVKATGLVVGKTDLDQLAKNILSPQTPAGYLASGDPQMTFSVKSTDKTSARLDVKASLDLSPQIDTAQIRTNLRGKSRQVAREYLESLPGVSEAQIEYSPRLPEPLLSMPRVENHISIVIP